MNNNLSIGYKHGRLTILSLDRSNTRRPKYLCQCECGKTKLIQVANLSRTHSCGCLRVEQLRARSITHGMSNSVEYRTWADMIGRCTRANDTHFDNYGGRGITVCQRWLNSFEAFYADMGPKPSAKHTIERSDNGQGYAPENCRWATMKEQRINQRRTQLISFQGITATMTDHAMRCGLNYRTVKWRIRHGWPIERALSAPSHR